MSVAAGSLGLGLVVGLALAIIAPFALGDRTYTVMSGSMEPAIGTGDVVVDDPIAPMDARPGDVVTFRDPQRASRMITHRVRSVHRRGAKVQIVTKGDANNAVERWSVPATGHIGRVAYRVPKAGYALFYVRTRLGRVVFVVLPAIAFCLYELWRIWRPRRREDEEVVDTAPLAPDPIPALAPDPIPAAERLPEGAPEPLPWIVPVPDREQVLR